MFSLAKAIEIILSLCCNYSLNIGIIKLLNVYNLNCIIHMGYHLFGVLRCILQQMCSCTTADFSKSCMNRSEVKIEVLAATGQEGQCKIRALTFEWTY